MWWLGKVDRAVNSELERWLEESCGREALGIALGWVILQRRLDKGWSPGRLADLSGVARQTIRKIEKGRCTVSNEVLG